MNRNSTTRGAPPRPPPPPPPAPAPPTPARRARLPSPALPGYWPGQPDLAGSVPGAPPQAARPALLPPAPENGSGLCTPRQVSAGVPAGVDDVTCRALFQRPNRHGRALSTAATSADALASAAPPMPLPFAAGFVPATTANQIGYGHQQDGPP